MENNEAEQFGAGNMTVMPGPTETPKSIFVVMPFTSSPSRSASQLDAYFEHTLKRHIEECDSLSNRYIVVRSGNQFDITAEIIGQLYSADIVLCDLSGESANPNVMYELGVRLSVTNKPTILIRESSPGNKKIFDIQGFYTHEYDPLQYNKLQDHVVSVLRSIELGSYLYSSPVLDTLGMRGSPLDVPSMERAIFLLDRLRGGLLTQMIVAFQAVVQHMKQRGYVYPKKEGNLFEAIADFSFKDERAAAIDWGGFGYTPRSHPSIDYYLSNRYLHGLIVADVELGFDELLQQLYNVYLVDNYIWSVVCSHQKLAMFFHETVMLWALAEDVSKLLSATKDSSDYDKALGKARATVLEAIRLSHTRARLSRDEYLKSFEH